MRAARILLAGFLPIMLALPALANGGAEGWVSIGAQGWSESGDPDRFAEDSGGEQSGLLLETLQWRPPTRKVNVRLDAAFTTGRSGWLDLSVAGGRWSGGLRTTLHTSWSDTSFADEFLPSGTSVQTLFPGTTELDPLFGIGEPRAERLWADAFLRRSFRTSDQLTLRIRALSHDGERVPTIGGYSFSDVGTLSAYNAGLETFDASSTSVALEGRFGVGPVGLSVEAGTRQRESRRALRMPTWGSDDLLGINAWEDEHDADDSWARLAASWRSEAWRISASVAYSSSENTPDGRDREEDLGGAVIREGLEIVAGQIDRTVVSGALGASWSPGPRLRVSAAADLQRRDGDGTADLTLVGVDLGPARSELCEDSIGGSADVTARLGGGTLRADVRFSRLDKDVEESRSSFLQVNRRRRDRTQGRVRFSRPVGAARLSVWGSWRDDDIEVDVEQLFDGYVTGDWRRTRGQAGASLTHRKGARRASFKITAANDDLDLESPFFDPIFDPSQRLFPVSGDEKLNRASGSLLWTGGKGDGWVEVGWIEARFDYPTSGVQEGFAGVPERVRGMVVAGGGRLSAWRSGSLAAQLEWVDDGLDLDRALVRAHVELLHRLRETLQVFGRWSVWDYSAALAPSDEYTYHLLTAGVRVGW